MEKGKRKIVVSFTLRLSPFTNMIVFYQALGVGSRESWKEIDSARNISKSVSEEIS